MKVREIVGIIVVEVSKKAPKLNVKVLASLRLKMINGSCHGSNAYHQHGRGLLCVQGKNK